MTEEEKRVIRKVAEEIWEQESAPTRMSFIDRVINKTEERLLPKHPPKGAIIETKLRWTLEDRLWRVTDDFHWEEVDHYRRIVTAEEALDAIDEAFKHGGTLGVMEAYDYLRDIVKSLIDNAERG